MLDLRDLIIERIQEVNTLTLRLQNLTQSRPGSSLDSQFHVNRGMLRAFSQVRKRQKQRTQREEELLQQIKGIHFWQSRVLEEFLNISLTIFSKFDPSFLQLLESGKPASQQLKRVFTRFAGLQHPKDKKRQIFSVVSGDVGESTPLIMMGWVCQWSQGRLGEQLHRTMSAQFDRHQEQMKRLSVGRGRASGEKIVNPLSVSSNVARSTDSIPICALTNKESVFGLFLDELNHYYKGMPLDLDFGFIKSIRKVHSKGNEFEREDNLQRAVDILIEAKNKGIKEERELFKTQFMAKFPQNNRYKQEEDSCPILMHSQSKVEKKNKKKYMAKDSFFERIKSESKEEEAYDQHSPLKNRESLLLCPKATEISFESSREILSKLRRQRQRKDLQLPQIMQSRFVVAAHSKSTGTKNKAMHFMAPVSKSLISNYEKALMKSSDQVNEKVYEFKQPYSIEKLLRKNNYSCTNDARAKVADNPESFGKKIEGDEFKRNRKLMLQLLREKNRQIFLDK